MPCACKFQNMENPLPEKWGSIFWSIFHKLADNVTKTLSPSFQMEERKTWILFIKETENVLPCEICAGHFKEYLQANPVDDILTIPYSSLKNWIQLWFYTLHSSVNKRLGKTDIDFDELSYHYKDIDIRKQLLQIEKLQKTTIQEQKVRVKPWTNWVKYARIFINMYGL